jgi:hypothetical protein
VSNHVPLVWKNQHYTFDIVVQEEINKFPSVYISYLSPSLHTILAACVDVLVHVLSGFVIGRPTVVLPLQAKQSKLCQY